MSHKMLSVRRQSIEEDFELCEEDEIPSIPIGGARVKVQYAGVTYTDHQIVHSSHRRPKIPGVLDTSLFPGYEVSGVIDDVCETTRDTDYKPGDRVVIYPGSEDLPQLGYDQYVAVQDVESLVKIPDSLSLQVASLLPAGALRAYAAVMRAKPFIFDKMQRSSGVTNLLIVGAGGLGLWTLLMAKRFVGEDCNKVHVTVADTNMDKLMLAKDYGCFDIIQWNETIHEGYILERTMDVCKGGVDVAIDFVSSPRTIKRSLKVLKEEGVVLVGGNSKHEVTFDLNTLATKNQSVLGVHTGTKAQLEELVEECARGRLSPPAYKVFPLNQATQVFQQLGQCKLSGRAVLQVCPEEEEESD